MNKVDMAMSIIDYYGIMPGESKNDALERIIMDRGASEREIVSALSELTDMRNATKTMSQRKAIELSMYLVGEVIGYIVRGIYTTIAAEREK